MRGLRTTKPQVGIKRIAKSPPHAIPNRNLVPLCDEKVAVASASPAKRGFWRGRGGASAVNAPVPRCKSRATCRTTCVLRAPTFRAARPRTTRPAPRATRLASRIPRLPCTHVPNRAARTSRLCPEPRVPRPTPRHACCAPCPPLHYRPHAPRLCPEPRVSDPAPPVPRHAPPPPRATRVASRTPPSPRVPLRSRSASPTP